MQALYDGAKAVCSGAASVLKLSSASPSPKKEVSEKKKHMEPLSLVISFALAALLPPGIKPIYKRKRITWELPEFYELPGGIKVPTQWMKRRYKNLTGEGVADRKVIDGWQETLQKAVFWYEPQTEQGAALREIFRMAIKGLENVHQAYVKDPDGTAAVQINSCIGVIKDSIELEVPIVRIVTINELSERIKLLWDAERMSTLQKYFNEIQQLFLNPSQKHFEGSIRSKTLAITGIQADRCFEFGKLLKLLPSDY